MLSITLTCGRPAGIDEMSDIVRLDGNLGSRRVTATEDFLIGEVGAGTAKGQDMLHAGRGGTGQALDELRLDDHAFWPAVAENVGDLGSRQPEVDGDRGPAGELARRIGLHVFGTILRQDRDAVAALDA